MSRSHNDRDDPFADQPAASPDAGNQPPMAVAMIWVSRITTISLEMVLPAAGGYWLDQRLGTRFWVVLGMLFGSATGFWHLLSLTKPKAGSK